MLHLFVLRSQLSSIESIMIVVFGCEPNQTLTKPNLVRTCFTAFTVCYIPMISLNRFTIDDNFILFFKILLNKLRNSLRNSTFEYKSHTHTHTQALSPHWKRLHLKVLQLKDINHQK